MIPDLATLEGNVRPTAVFDNHQVDARLKTLVDRINENTPFQLSLEVLFSLQPVVTKEEHPRSNWASPPLTPTTRGGSGASR